MEGNKVILNNVLQRVKKERGNFGLGWVGGGGERWERNSTWVGPTAQSEQKE